ncbi:MotA/TolQ/ExbB proton channel family protein [Aquibacillus salsiterrae]|uniref:MotA/TolQ/ExbB proton channel family protein n=1 Tax=Aquibacillus salsiterrae TaxID=2950439 RepID=A0A9X3WD04_9BACI|nr:MotA/TolQ/ExbB proton channel family protein [Aquibacillus salsiterrae]MDC3417312.1 MotA/TolQ/ExbB proton channel family protein [Aquibacillus salsiterrae]
MLETILKLFTSEQKAEAILSNSTIELVFTILFLTFVVAVFIHLSLFAKLKKIRNYLRHTNRMDVDPLRSFKEEFERNQKQEAIKVETFVQDKFSGWRIFNVPVVSLIKMIQATVSIFILIGVLGTFIGLTMSLGNISSSGDQLVENVANVLSGIDVAFYTSIAGMGLSLIMTVLIKAFNSEYLLTDIMLKVESTLSEEEQNGMGRLITVSEAINHSIGKLQETNQESLLSIVTAFDGFKEYTAGLQQSAEDLAKFNDGLSKNLKDFQVLFDSLKEVTNGIADGTNRLNENFGQLFDYFKQMDSRNERMAKLFEDTYEKAKETSKAQTNTLKQFEGSVEDLKSFTASILDKQEVSSQSLEKINQKNYELVEKLEKHNKEFKQIFGSDISSKLAGITSYLSELSGEFNKFGDSIVHLPEALQTINQAQLEYKHLFSDRMEELKQFNRDFHNHLKAHSSDSIAFEKHLLEATNTYEQVGIKNNQLIHEINATITQMNHSFNQKENQMEASVTILKDTLSNYVMNLEGTLGDKLDKVVRSFHDYIDQTNQGLKKEFKELRVVNEEIQQSSNRYAQQTFSELNQEIHRLNQHLEGLSRQATATPTARLGQHD